ncbi:hypothetical protein ETAA8_47450 [Anatilimnocola aggregata]|uniref:Uncharacterized protein n=1 Tax=Anatilimnocola aggregata TaxID=2528021 RepID=A0A517YHC2_9BACT|nr:hypothetical protein [Anatilimnocola aggregata]QDU29630.1 hypothetical protein ETAA8_47450 [Anatilimnocola aggregata]
MIRTLCLCGFLLIYLLLPQAAVAQPQQEGPSFGWEETILPVMELDSVRREELKAETGFDLSLGFAYRRAYVFSPAFSFWHWRGRFLLYFGGNLFEPSSAQLTAILGKEQFAALKTPLIYRLPPGFVTTLLLVVFVALVIYLFPPEHVRVGRLLNEPKYIRAVELYHASLPAGEEPTASEIETGIATAADYLVQDHAVAKPQAEKSLRHLLGELNRARTYELRQAASAFEQSGSWEEARDLYEEASELREPWDAKDHAFLLKCVRRVESKMK